MTPNLLTEHRGGSFLLELLHLAGWRLEVRGGDSPQIRATRANVVLEVTGRTLAEATGIAFARAMRSGNRERTRKDSGPTRRA
jgi:hypothetical protein